jgi:hypothetical protein
MLGYTQMHRGHFTVKWSKFNWRNKMTVNLRTLASALFLMLMLPLVALAGGLPRCPVENAVVCGENVALVSRPSVAGPSIWVHTKERVAEAKLNEIKKLEGVAYATAYNDYLVSIERAPMVPEKELVEKIYSLFEKK